ncbi:hypothetical protein [Sphingobium aromaticiconvertens]|uniref:hypothetical protein n=1 Tax=Sphingobium aromaticiconvertens TaxID=365341 RepID=UPI00301AF49E
MRRLLFSVSIPLSLIALPAPVSAQEMGVPAPCAAPADLPEALAGWRNPAPATAGNVQAKAVALPPGKAVILALLPTPKVTYPLRPEKPGGSVSFGGLASFTVAQTGTWRVALGSGAWVDVVKNGKAMTSIAHGHGPDCSGIRKMVDYSLTPGRYVLQVAANGTDSLPLLVTRLQ